MQTTDTPTREIERTYEVTFADRKVTVRLRYTPGEEPADRQGDAATDEALRRAERIRNRKGMGTADAMSIDWTREQLVEARPVDLQALATPKPERRPKGNATSHDSNGWR